MKHSKLLEALDAVFQNEGCTGSRCDSTTCDIHTAYDHGYDLWAYHLWSSSGAASEEFEALYKSLRRQYKTLARAEEKQRKGLLKEVEHVQCEHCNAIIWEPSWCDGYCSSCGGQAKGDAK